MSTPPRRRRIGDPPQPRVRVIVSITPETLKILNHTAGAMGYSRSAVAAMAIEKGLPLITEPHS